MLSKMTLTALALTLISAAAQANDGGMAYIDVQGINPATTNHAGEVIKVKSGSVITFYGKDAESFMRLLPTDSTVLDGMMSPADAELRQQNQRALAIVSDGWTLSFYCGAADINLNEGRNGKPTVTKLPTTTCTVALNKNESPEYKYDMLGDIFKLDIKDKSQRTCQ